MNKYKEYMARQHVSPACHARLLALETAAAPAAPARRKNFRLGYAAMAACCVLALTAVLLHRPATPDVHLPPIPAPDPLTDPIPDRGTPPPVTEPARSDVPDATEIPVPTPAPDASVSVKDKTAGSIGIPDYAFTVPERGEAQMFPAIPAVNYADVTGSPAIIGDRAKYPDDAFERPLTREEILSVLWGGEAPVDEVPWMLFWDGFSIYGRAGYGQSGALYWVWISGTHPDGRAFIINLARDAIPADFVYADAAKGEWAGTEYTAWSRRAEGGTLCCFQLLRGGVGVSAHFSTPDGVSENEPYLTGDLFLRWCCCEPGLTLDHIAYTGDIPAYAHHIFQSYADALAEPDFARYLPVAAPTGFCFADGEMRYREGDTHNLWLRWEKGYDNVTVNIDLPEDPDKLWDRDPVDISDPAAYDLRLYTIPWCDSVPEQYMDSVSHPAFRAEDMSPEVLLARQNEMDTGGDWYQFYVVYPGGVLVRWSISGLSPEAAWALVEPTLS